MDRGELNKPHFVRSYVKRLLSLFSCTLKQSLYSCAIIWLWNTSIFLVLTKLRSFNVDSVHVSRSSFHVNSAWIGKSWTDCTAFVYQVDSSRRFLLVSKTITVLLCDHLAMTYVNISGSHRPLVVQNQRGEVARSSCHVNSAGIEVSWTNRTLAQPLTPNVTGRNSVSLDEVR